MIVLIFCFVLIVVSVIIVIAAWIAELIERVF